MSIRKILSNKKILVGMGIAVVVIAGAIGATTALFQDVEVSTGNKFTAGDFDLLIDSECSYNGQPQAFCTWLEPKDLDGELFFNFNDVKPGDSGEDTISFRIIDNDAWLCAEVSGLVNQDNGCRKPEQLIGDTTCGNPGIGEGELQDNIFFTIWKDTDCDNELDGGEQILVQDKPAEAGIWAIADSMTGTGVIPGDTRICYGLSWNVPLSTSNIIQSDSLIGNLKFIAVQARHMDTFKCSELATGGNGPQCAQNSDCNDGVYCNGVETCNAEGVCLPGAGDPCPGPDGDNDCSESCNETTDNCTANDPNDSACLNGTCSDGLCIISDCTPTPEVCDGKDNDCDGQIDEDGVCGACVWSPEVCDGIDNNCDGVIDEGLVGLNAPYCALQQAVCAGSHQVCGGTSGWLACGSTQYGPNYEATETTCDGLDNDCDGTIDEGCPAWVSPTSYFDNEDANGYWDSETNAYDGNTGTRAYAYVRAYPSWGPFLELNLANPVSGNKLRYWIPYAVSTHYINQMDVDVYRNGSWYHVYHGAIDSSDAWTEHSFSAGTITKARIRYYNSYNDGDFRSRGLVELQIWDN